MADLAAFLSRVNSGPATPWEPFWARAHATVVQSNAYLSQDQTLINTEGLASTCERLKDLLFNLQQLHEEGSVDGLESWVRKVEEHLEQARQLAEIAPAASLSTASGVAVTWVVPVDERGCRTAGRLRAEIDVPSLKRALARGSSVSSSGASTSVLPGFPSPRFPKFRFYFI